MGRATSDPSKKAIPTNTDATAAEDPGGNRRATPKLTPKPRSPANGTPSSRPRRIQGDDWRNPRLTFSSSSLGLGTSEHVDCMSRSGSGSIRWSRMSTFADGTIQYSFVITTPRNMRRAVPHHPRNSSLRTKQKNRTNGSWSNACVRGAPGFGPRRPLMKSKPSSHERRAHFCSGMTLEAPVQDLQPFVAIRTSMAASPS